MGMLYDVGKSSSFSLPNDIYIEQFGNNEQLLSIGAHLHIASMVLPGFHSESTHARRYNWTRRSSRGTVLHHEVASRPAIQHTRSGKFTQPQDCAWQYQEWAKDRQDTN
eukprot:6214004-Amphidinium_carterae.5